MTEQPLLDLEPFHTLRRAEELLSVLPKETASKLTIAGGQALMVWAEYYLIDSLTGFEYENLASDDLDLLGRKQEVEACARAWGGRAQLPQPFDNSPQSGIVFLEDDGVLEAIDFLSHIYGLNDKQVRRYCDKLIFGDNMVAVMSPPLCLKSRIANLAGLGYSDEKAARECVRIKLAASACRAYILDQLERDSLLPARKVIKYLVRNVFSTTEAVRVEAKYNVKFEHCFPEAIKARLPLTWERYLPLWLGKHHDKVARLKRRLDQ